MGNGFFSFIKILLVIAACLLLFMSCHKNKQPELLFLAHKADYNLTVDETGELEAKISRPVAAPRIRRSSSNIAKLIPEGTFVKKDQVVVELEARNVETRYNNAIDALALAKAEATRKEAELSMETYLLESEIQATKASLVTAELQLNKLAYEAKNVQEKQQIKIEERKLELQKLEKKFKSLEKIQKEEKIRVQMKIKQAANDLKESKRILETLVLKSPVNGIVVYSRHWATGEDVKEGDPAFGGMPLIQIPDLSEMQVILNIYETDAQKISVKDSAVIQVPMLKDKLFSGRVSKIDKIAKPVKKGSNVKKVQVTVDIDSTQKGMLPGMSARCSIIYKRALNSIAIPKEAVFTIDSLKFCFFKSQDKYVPLQVINSIQSDDFIYLQQDLKSVEIPLFSPEKSKINWPDSLSAIRKEYKI